MVTSRKNTLEMQPSQIPNDFQLMGAGAGFKEEVCEMIAHTGLFADFDWKNIEALAGYVQCYKVAAGAVIFKEGDIGNYMCLLIKGQIEILKEDQSGKPHHMAFIMRGKTFGEMSIIDNEHRSATCLASHESILLLLTRQNYSQIVHEKPALAVSILAKLAKLMSQRLRSLSGQMVEHLE